VGCTNRRVMPKADFAKWPKPEEIARVILFLCSEDARVIHGAAIPVYERRGPSIVLLTSRFGGRTAPQQSWASSS
jgi:hypothetical protein